MGTMEATCGALVGAAVVAGLKTQGEGTMRRARQMIGLFRARCGAVACAELKAAACPCEECVRGAVLAYGEAMRQ